MYGRIVKHNNLVTVIEADLNETDLSERVK